MVCAPALHLAPLLLGRASLALAPYTRMSAAIGHLRDAPCAARFVLLIQLARGSGRPAPVGQRLDRDQPLELADADRQLVTGCHVSGGFHPLAADLDLAAGDGRLCEGTGLEKSRGPEPLI